MFLKYLLQNMKQMCKSFDLPYMYMPVLIFFHLLARKPNLDKFYTYSNKFFHNFHLSESSFTCPGLRASGIVRRLHAHVIFMHSFRKVILYRPSYLILDFVLSVPCIKTELNICLTGQLLRPLTSKFFVSQLFYSDSEWYVV